MKEEGQMTKACYGTVSGVTASASALVYWFLALKIKPDSSLGIMALGNIFCSFLYMLWNHADM